jgi:hypothetical protein
MNAQREKTSASSLAQAPLTLVLSAITLCLGLIHAWAGRDSMNPDGMSYLDLGAAFYRHDWANAVNAWWSPLYAWILGTAVGAVKPSIRSEFPLVHAVNFAIFAATVAAFVFFLRSLLRFRKRFDDDAGIPDWPFVLVGFSIFWWIALELETLYDVSPDLLAAACFFVTMALLVQLEASDKVWRFALLGLSLGVGYWTKAILLPLGLATLAIAFWWKRSEPRWRGGIAIAALVFVCVSSPLILVLSKQKGRFTFGDSGKGNYAWSMSPLTRRRNWQGREPLSGTPVHPTRELMEHPPAYEFDGPVIGTYPPWTDPSYWNEGLQGHFQRKAEVNMLLATVPGELRLLLRAEPGLVVGVIALALLCGASWWTDLRRVWPLLAIPSLGMAAYLPLVENDRYLGGFVAVMFLALLWTAQSGEDNSGPRRDAIVIAISLAVFASMAIGTADYTARILTERYAIPGVGPNSTAQDVVAAEELERLGLKPGDKVAIIGNGTEAYWAHLAQLRIVAEVMEIKGGTTEFWSSPEDTKQRVYQAFRKANAVKAIAACTTCAAQAANSDGWQPIAQTPYSIHSLP